MRSISSVCSSEHVGQQCPLRESDRDALHSSIIFCTRFHATAVAALGIPRRNAVDSIEGCFTGRAVERCWSALVEIRNVASSVESRNTGPYLCLIGDEVGTEVPSTEVWRWSLHAILDSASGFWQQRMVVSEKTLYMIYEISNLTLSLYSHLIFIDFTHLTYNLCYT